MKVRGCLWAVVFLSGCATAPRVSSSAGGDISGEGLASWYGKQFAGKKTASGELFNPNALTGAHRTLRFGTCVKVELLSNARTVEVRINDRGPFVQNRLIDLSEEAARRLGLIDEGVSKVRISSCR